MFKYKEVCKMKFRMIKIIGIVGFLVAALSLPCSSSDITKSLIFPEYSRRISMDFKDADLKDVLKIFSQQSGLNFIASADIEDKMITMYLDDVPVEDALEQLLTANRLKYEIQRGTNIFIVKPQLIPEIVTITRVYFLKNASVSGAKLLSAISGVSAGTAEGGEEGGGEGGEEGGEEGGGEGGGAITSILSTLLSNYGVISEDARTNSITITDIPSRFPLIEETLARLDVSVPLVLIEVEMLDVSKNAVDALGVEWPEALAKLDVTGARVTQFPFGGSKANNADYTFSDITTPSGNWTFTTLSGNHFAPSVLTVIGAELALDFLSTQTDTKYLARPRILTLSNETAEIRISTEEAIGQSTISSGEGAGSQSSTEAERFTTGVVMKVTPQVNVDTGEITMYIDPKVIEAKVGNTFGGVLYRDPETRGTKSVIRVRDGDTIVIGGLMKKQKQETLTKVPFLGDIPLIGFLFRHKNITKDEDRELITFITPHIVKDPATMRTLASVRELDREQEVPASRINVINDALADMEKKRR